MQVAYDFHIHTAASPCGDEYMSPNNILNMAQMNKLQVIAITDHNSCVNCEVMMKLGKEKGILVIPGMEIECQEEFHSIALFPNIEAAYTVEEEIKKYMPPIKNKIHIFGNQWVMNEADEVIGEMTQLLLTATQLPAEHVYQIVRRAGGVIYPAHIDRNSYSVLSNLGCIPPELNIKTIEISKRANKRYYQEIYSQYTIIQSSDAHYLQDILEESSFLEIKKLDIEHILKTIE